MKAYVVGGDKNLVNFLPELEIIDNVKDANIVVFGDGPVVSPSLYKEKKHAAVTEKCDINRDRADKAIYVKLNSKQTAVGIGRGACFLAVMNGASLIQKIDRDNTISCPVNFKYRDKMFIFDVLTDQKQSINLKDCDKYELVSNTKTTRKYYTDDVDTERFMNYNGDPEVVIFSKEKGPKSVCIQFHPEWLPDSTMSKILKQVIYGCNS